MCIGQGAARAGDVLRLHDGQRLSVFDVYFENEGKSTAHLDMSHTNVMRKTLCQARGADLQHIDRLADLPFEKNILHRESLRAGEMDIA